MFNFSVGKQEFFGDYHEMTPTWARILAFDQVFGIRTVQTCSWYYAKDEPCRLLQSLSLGVCLYTFISCYLKKIIKIGFPNLCDIIPKAQIWLVLNLPVFMFVYIHFNVPSTRLTDLVRNVSDEKIN